MILFLFFKINLYFLYLYTILLCLYEINVHAQHILRTMHIIYVYGICHRFRLR